MRSLWLRCADASPSSRILHLSRLAAQLLRLSGNLPIPTPLSSLLPHSLHPGPNPRKHHRESAYLLYTGSAFFLHMVKDTVYEARPSSRGKKSVKAVSIRTRQEVQVWPHSIKPSSSVTFSSHTSINFSGDRAFISVPFNGVDMHVHIMRIPTQIQQWCGGCVQNI